MDTSDLIALGGAGLLGILLYNKVDNALGDLDSGVRTISNSYTSLTESVSKTTKEASNYFPYLGGDDNASPQEQAFRSMPKADMDKPFLDLTQYSAAGYRDVSKIGTSPHTSNKGEDIREVISKGKQNTMDRRDEINRGGLTKDKIKQYQEHGLSPMAAYGGL